MKTRECANCGKPVRVRYGSERYCGATCRRAKHLEMQRSHRGCEVGEIPCRQCGELFESRNGSKVCSEECRRERHRRGVKNRPRSTGRYYEFTHSVTGERYRLYESGVTRKVG